MRSKRVRLSLKSLFFVSLFFTSLFALVWSTPVQAQRDLLTRAQVYRVLNQVQLLLRNKPVRRARLRDVLVPLDALRTRGSSRAELLFNEGSLARIGSYATFRFKSGLRRFQLPGRGLRSETILEMRKGVAVVMVPSSGSTTKVETDGATLNILAFKSDGEPLPEGDNLPSDIAENFRGSAVAIIADDTNKNSRFLNLTRHPVVVNNTQGTQTVILRGGQTVAVRNGVIGEVETFDLKKFYQTSKLAAGLGPGQEELIVKEAEPVQKTLRALRKEALLTIENQGLWVEGLCSLNSRTSASTLSTNCITTDGDPLDKFEDIREVIPPRDTGDDGGNDIDTGIDDIPVPDDTGNPNGTVNDGGNDIDTGINDIPVPDNTGNNDNPQLQ
ncbi:MAG: hypothetical protein AAF316_10100 [Cyanobacteria bacterium P01_A01_bin.80]